MNQLGDKTAYVLLSLLENSGKRDNNRGGSNTKEAVFYFNFHNRNI